MGIATFQPTLRLGSHSSGDALTLTSTIVILAPAVQFLFIEN